MAKTERRAPVPQAQPGRSNEGSRPMAQPGRRPEAYPQRPASRSSRPTNQPSVNRVVIPEQRSQLPLTRANFIMMAICGAMIVIGFALMLGGSTTVDQFNEDIFSARRIVVGPALSFIGFVLMAVAILYRRKSNNINPEIAE